MAKRGEPKPNAKTKLGMVLSAYTRKNHGSYDVEFDKQIREISTWFDYIDTASQNKQLLLDMAKRGEPKPKKNIKLGMVLRSYLRKDQRSYDAEFDKQIREISTWIKNND